MNIEARSKVLLVSRNFPPLVGGMEKLNLHVYRGLCKEFEVVISGPVGSRNFHEAKHFVEFPIKPLWKYVLSSMIKTVMLARKACPRIIFCGSGAAIFAGYIAARYSAASLVCYIHGLDIIIDSWIYRIFFLPLIKKADLLIANSNHTKMLAIKAGFDPQRIKILHPGTSIPSHDERETLINIFREKYNLSAVPYLLIVGRLTARKGVVEFIDKVMPNLVSQHPQLKLIIVGDEAGQAMKYQAGIKEKIIERTKKLSLQKNILMVGAITDEMLSAALFGAELLVFPVLNMPNDVEGFGMVAVEAAAHGTPAIGFSCGGIPDAISHGISGWLVEPGNYDQLEQSIVDCVFGSNNKAICHENCIAFAMQFEWRHFYKKLNMFVKTL